MSADEDRLAKVAAELDGRASVADIWKARLAKRGDGYAGDERNVLLALRHAPELVGLLRYNAFSLNVEFTRSPPWRHAEAGSPWMETDDTALQTWLQAQGIAVRGRSTVADTVILAAQDSTYHPVRQYLEALAWDGTPRLKVWLDEYLNAEGPPAYHAAVGRRFLVSAVARIFSPGCQADHVLTLEGPQGCGKTTTARVLAVRPEWFADNLPDIHTKDAPLQLLSRWIIEVAELKAVRNSQLEAVKSFITTTADTFRPPYGRRAAQFPRQSVFIATTNEDEYLRDRTGNRRFWPVRCGRIRLDALAADRDQLWAEAVHEYRAGTAWHLTDEENALAMLEQRDRVHVSELEADVAEYLDRRLSEGVQQVSTRDVLVSGLGLDANDKGYAETARRLGSAVADAMKRAGWKKAGRPRTGGGKRTLYRYGGQGGQGK